MKEPLLHTRLSFYEKRLQIRQVVFKKPSEPTRVRAHLSGSKEVRWTHVLARTASWPPSAVRALSGLPVHVRTRFRLCLCLPLCACVCRADSGGLEAVHETANSALPTAMRSRTPRDFTRVSRDQRRGCVWVARRFGFLFPRCLMNTEVFLPTHDRIISYYSSRRSLPYPLYNI